MSVRGMTILALAALSVGGCATLEPVESEGLNPARLAFAGDPPQIILPDTVAAGATVRIQLNTYGGGCIRKGPTQIVTTATAADVRPMDHFPSREAVCTSDLRLIAHDTTFSVGSAGTFVVRVHGTEVEYGGGQPERRPITITRRLTVR